MSIITPSGLPTELAEITNGETLIEVYNPDTGQNEKTEIDTIKTYIQEAIESTFSNIVLNTTFPIGKRIIQLPGESSPAVLYTSQTWINISSTFAGDFFRVEGGNASVFNSGEQPDRFQGHHHQALGQSAAADGASFTGLTNKSATSINYIQEPISDGVNGTPRTGIETNPVNWTIRIWERTA